ncbi:MF6LB protein, partial [Semnornis frantzii]|nr:MF6LB protein [Semnornis frantzii]
AMNEQWDIGRALALSGLFRLLQGAGRACAAPFLTLYLRHLGFTAPLVGIVAGAQQLPAALWAPLCSRCPRGRRKRRLVVAGALLGSAGASLLLTLIPPAVPGAGFAYCNASQQPGDRGAATAVPALGISRDSVLSMSAVTNSKAVTKEALQATADVLRVSRKPELSSDAFQESSGLADTLGKKGTVEGDGKTTGYLDGPSGWTASVKAVNWETQEPEMLPSSTPPDHGLEKGMSSAADVSFEALQSIFRDRENQIFLMVLGAVVVWELLATTLEQTVDDSLYEYLDFVDATDRYGRLWIWSYLGASVGACSISVIVDQLNCFLSSSITRLAVHFYGYALLVTLSLLASAFFPIQVPKQPDRVNRTGKALALLWGEGRAFLCAVTVFLSGAASSAMHNFLFWQLEDQGSSELYMGLSVALALLAEILLSFFRGRLLRTFSSSKIVAASLSLLAAQLLCYSFLWTAWPVLLLQTLSAFSSGALWWVVNMTVDDITTPGMERALHSVLRGLFHSGGVSLGSLAGGFVMEHFGLAVLYRACCVGLVLWLFFFLLVQSKLPRQKKINYSRLLAADSSDVSDSDEENERDWLVKAMKEESFN